MAERKQIASFEVRGASTLKQADAVRLAKKLWGRRVGGVLLSGRARGVLRISNQVKAHTAELDAWLKQTGNTLIRPPLRAELSDPWKARLIITR
jgi:hypothetical protein